MSRRIALAFEVFDRAELGVSTYLNRSGSRHSVRRLFGVVSRLGDGWFWYALILGLPWVYGPNALAVSAQMVLAGAAGLVVYKVIKGRAERERPYVTHSAIRCLSTPLDKYSFPSGHTLHAVSFTFVAGYHLPELGPPLAIFALLVALSRVTLGLHYPTDVAAGALLGALVAGGSFMALG